MFIGNIPFCYFMHFILEQREIADKLRSSNSFHK